MSADLIQKVTVMRYNDNGIFKIHKEIFKPADSRKVKVVCRLVKQENIGVAEECLRSMEADGIVTRTVYAEVPPRVEYALSELGESLQPILDAMKAWGESYQKDHANG